MATWLGCAVLGLCAAGCSIEGTRQRGDECLQDRECVSPLRCEVTTDGRSLCVTPTRLDAGTAPAVDAGAADAGTPPVDAPKAVDVQSPPDVSMAVDLGGGPDVMDVPAPTDVPVDVGAVLIDGGVADARADVTAADRPDVGDASDAGDGAGDGAG